MSKLEVIRVEWVNDQEVHIYPPGAHSCWWARPMRMMRKGEVQEAWELADDSDDVEGYYETPELAFQAVSEKFDDAPIVIAKERDE